MNGQIPPVVRAFGPFGTLRSVLRPDLYSKRLFLALAASGLAHAAVIFLPYFGASTADFRAAVPGQAAARSVSVRLILESGPAAPAPGSVAVAASTPEPPASRPAEEAPRPAPDRGLGSDLLPVPAPAFYTTNQLTKRPRPTSEPKLDVPELGPVFPQGKVILKVWISELGQVVSVGVEESDLPETVSATAVAAFGKLRFVPGEINGRRVGVMMKIEVTYDENMKPPP
jgi:hypothetical protein